MVPPERDTVVETGGGSGAAGVIAVVGVIVVVLLLLFLFRGQLGFGAEETEVSVPETVDVNAN